MKVKRTKVNEEWAVEGSVATPAEKEFMKALCGKTSGLPGWPDAHAERMFTAFATLVTQSWAACRFKKCRRARYCLAPYRPIAAAVDTDEYREVLGRRVIPPCLTDPGWYGNLQDFVKDATKEFAEMLEEQRTKADIDR